VGIFSMLLVGVATGQQPANPAPAGANIQQLEPRNPAVQLQRNQQGFRQRAPQRQPFAPFTNRNNRDPREDAFLDEQQRRLALQNQGLDENGQPLGNQQQGDPSLIGLDSGGYSSGGAGAVTAEQGRGQALSEVIRGMGAYNRDTAAAAVLQEHARDHAIDNWYDQVDTYFDARRLNRQERNAERGPVPTPDAVYRYSKMGLPQRLSLAALDRLTGAIHWPAALMAPAFAEHRARLEQSFQARSFYDSGIASPSYLEIKDESERMLATLQDRVRDMDPAAYMQARRFIIGLGYEGRFPATNEGIALSG
jgi:hypothetical protein